VCIFATDYLEIDVKHRKLNKNRTVTERDKITAGSWHRHFLLF